MKIQPAICQFLISVSIASLIGCSSEDTFIQPTPAEPPPSRSIDDFGVEVLSRSIRSDGTSSDITGYVDPTSGEEYAILGDLSGEQLGDVIIYKVLNDGQTEVVSEIAGIAGFDIKVFRHYLYIANGGPFGAADPKSFIYDISDPSNPTRVGEFAPAHNITIDPRGYIYLSGTHDGDGLVLMNLNEAPENPERIWSDRYRTGGHDASVIGNRLYDFHGSFTVIYDITDAENPIQLSTITDPGIGYHHSGWTTSDGNFLYICDEGGNAYFVQPDITIWDISDPQSPFKVGVIHDPTSRVHNLYIENNLAFVSYYEAGFRVFDLTSPHQPLLTGQLYTNISNGNGIGSGFSGAFGVHLSQTSDMIFVSDINNGLYIVRYDP